MNDTLPAWARKPKHIHSDKIVATERGWELTHTNEVLVSHKNLNKKLEVFSTPNTLPETQSINQASTVVPEVVKVVEPVTQETSTVSVDNLPKPEEVVTPPVVEEVVKEEPVKEEPVKEEPVKEQTIIVDPTVHLEEVSDETEEDETADETPVIIESSDAPVPKKRGRPKKVKAE